MLLSRLNTVRVWKWKSSILPNATVNSAVVSARGLITIIYCGDYDKYDELNEFADRVDLAGADPYPSWRKVVA